jgi:hypothetical protein
VRRACLLLVAGLTLSGAAPPLTFTPLAPEFVPAADEYRRIWNEEGARIAAAMERAAGLEFPAAPIEVLVRRGPPMASYDGRTIRMRAGYSTAYKKAALIHELGHRLSFLLPREPGLDDHRVLDLFLYDVWTDLYGEAFADRMVAIERRIAGRYDYDAAWSWALAMTREQLQARLAAALRATIRS